MTPRTVPIRRTDDGRTVAASHGWWCDPDRMIAPIRCETCAAAEDDGE